MKSFPRRELLKSAVAAAGLSILPSTASAWPFSHQKPVTKKRAQYWSNFGEDIACVLCPHNCILSKGTTGRCRTRYNDHGTLLLTGYGNPCTVHVDPIEKKPLFHVTPGTSAYSIGVAGCMLRCLNCQNYQISQESTLTTKNIDLMPEAVVSEALRNKCQAIAYTYSEPNAWYEYMIDTAKLAKQAGLKNLWITSGYINQAPVLELAKYIDAANINLKSFDDTIYMNLNAGRLGAVLDTIKTAKQAGIWIELTNLVVPQWTDNMDMIGRMCSWIKDNVGAEVPLHFLRFFPLYKLDKLYPTPLDTLVAAKKVAVSKGLQHVYIGNVAGVDENTYCAKCGKKIIEREGFLIKGNHIQNGKCGFCKEVVPGIWG